MIVKDTEYSYGRSRVPRKVHSVRNRWEAPRSLSCRLSSRWFGLPPLLDLAGRGAAARGAAALPPGRRAESGSHNGMLDMHVVNLHHYMGLSKCVYSVASRKHSEAF